MARGGRFSVTSPNETPPPATSSRAPRAGLRLMIIIVLALALVAVYANVQKARRDKIEKVTIIPISATPSASPSPAN
ncbi:MAG: hypothetical protein QOD80_695 [Verrucomicrobiota bacterium]|jgi:hypothetical protein